MSNYIIVDIETSPDSFDNFDDAQKEYLLRGATTEEEQQKKKAEMALTPLTGIVVCIGFIHMKRMEDGTYHEEKRVCLTRNFDNDESMVKVELESGTTMVRYSEQSLLQDFWKFVRSFFDGPKKPHFVTFNGRNFDFPFLMLRSAVLGIRPSVNLMSGSRWNYRDTHTDLMDELTFQIPQQSGATRRFNLDFYTKSFGIRSPKSAGVDGSKVAEYYAAKDYDTIAEYCMRDVQATWELYLKWCELLKN